MTYEEMSPQEKRNYTRKKNKEIREAGYLKDYSDLSDAIANFGQERRDNEHKTKGG